MRSGVIRKALIDLPKIGPQRFLPTNRIGFMCVPIPFKKNHQTGIITMQDGWSFEGWCNCMEEYLMGGREGQVGIMMFHEEYGNVWVHYPAYDEEDYRDSFFVWSEE